MKEGFNNDMHSHSAREASRNFFNQTEQYFCKDIVDYLKQLELPTLLTNHNGVSFIYITEGDIEIKVGFDNHIAVKGQMIILQQYKPFSIEKYSEDLQGYILYINADGIIGTMGNHSLIFSLDFLETWSDSLYNIEYLPVEFIENIFKRIIWQKVHKSENLMIVNAYVITLLLELNTLHNDMIQSNRASVDLSRRFKNEVYKSLDVQLTVSEFADRLSVTPNHLNKSIKSVTGHSASHLINKIKVTEAKYLLMMANNTVSDVAERLGFSDISYFSRFFKKMEAVTPNEYRKKIDMS